MSTATAQMTGREAYDLSTLLVDTDVHEVMPTSEVLLPYLAPEWHRFLKSGAVLNSGLPHAQWNNGAMDGFVRAHAGASQADVMGYYVRNDVPVSWGMADAFSSPAPC